MKIVKQFQLEIDGAVFTFRKPSAREVLDFDKEGKNALPIIFGHLLSVTGMEDEDGPVSLDNLRTLDIPMDVVTKIVNAWSDKLKELSPQAPIDPEKKISTNN